MADSSVDLGPSYRVERRLGSGGMGEVYLAEHRERGRLEAVKIIRSALARDPDVAARFAREVKALRRLAHPAIVAIYDAGQLPSGELFLAMEVVGGPTLAAAVAAAGVPPLTLALEVCAVVADGVAHAHAAGVVHRDLKPENIIASDEGGALRPKILDFGVSKIVAPDHQSKGLSKPGEIIGTPEYMAPEQFTSMTRDPRSDLYALGCVLQFMLTGQPPFSGRRLTLMDKHLREIPPPPSTVVPARRIGPAVDAIVARCLAKDPARRFPDAAGLAAALRAVRLEPAGFDDAMSDEPTVEVDRGAAIAWAETVRLPAKAG